MSEEEQLAAQLRLFCELMLGSPEAAGSALEQIHRRALEGDRPPDCVRLFRIAADVCGVRRP
ncbi:hypothetical protein GCM10009630_37010 [Kribbella jejuensis]|uniref:Uncharacterized protein n=1 Tax=Kribbella jejuensis TaxID=236068 RepID=A0A542ESL4_9ACTN|nr:hypothetical protein [Kribbella jejuensis]TQJ18347.1 hypothetical protein FB475_2482 [Kribbella jejuensis]